MSNDLTTEIASILDDFARGSITEIQRDEAISAIAARGLAGARTRSRITEIAVNAVDRDAA